MKTKRTTGNTRARRTVALLEEIPGWAIIDQVDLHDIVVGRRQGDARYAPSTRPDAVMKALVISLWFEAGRIERKKLFPGTCTGQTLTRTLRAWMPDYDDLNSSLRLAWRDYLSCLTKPQRAQWRKRLADQEDAWRDWKRASKLASRTFSPWFKAILAETNSNRSRKA